MEAGDAEEGYKFGHWHRASETPHDDDGGLSSSGGCKLGPLRRNRAKNPKISVRVLMVQRPAVQEEWREELFWKAALACLGELP
jgi:hypothetical protein